MKEFIELRLHPKESHWYPPFFFLQDAFCDVNIEIFIMILLSLLLLLFIFHIVRTSLIIIMIIVIIIIDEKREGEYGRERKAEKMMTKQGRKKKVRK